MRTTNLIALLGLTLVGGCWPYLSQPYEDYLDTSNPDPDSEGRDPDTSDPDTNDPDTEAPDGDGPTVIGFNEVAVLMGEYWQDPNAVSLTSLFGLGAPNANYNYIASWPNRGSCAAESSAGPDVVSLTSDRGLPVSTTVTMGSRNVALSEDANVAYVQVGGTDYSGTAPFNAQVTASFSADAGSFSGTFSRTPSDFTVTSPAMDDAGITVLPLDEFDVTFTGDGGDDVIVTVIFLDADFGVLDGAFCTAAGSSVTIDPGDYSSSGAAYAQIDVMRVRTFSGSLGGSAGGTSRMVSTLKKTGIIGFE